MIDMASVTVAGIVVSKHEPVFVKLSALPTEAVPFVEPAMVRAKGNCRHCHGRGNVGHLVKDVFARTLGKKVGAGTGVPCRCLMVDIVALKANVAQVKEATAKKMAEAKAALNVEGEPADAQQP